MKVSDVYLHAKACNGKTPGLRSMAQELQLMRKLYEAARDSRKNLHTSRHLQKINYHLSALDKLDQTNKTKSTNSNKKYY